MVVKSEIYFVIYYERGLKGEGRREKRSVVRKLVIFKIFSYICGQKRSVMHMGMIELGARLLERRELLGLLQSQLAELSGVSTRTIQLVEQGKGNPSLDTLLQLADPMGLRLDFLLKDPAKTGGTP
jgi:DNA-binding XRE family transcriptional regulator